MKKVEIQLTQTFEERPVDALQKLIGKKIEKIYTLKIALTVDSLGKSNDDHEKLFFKTSDDCIYEMSSNEYTEDYYFDMKKNAIKMVEQVEENYIQFLLPIGFYISKIFIFSLSFSLLGEEWHIQKIYGEKWHSEKRNIKFNKEFYPDIYIATTTEDSHIVFSNENDEFLSIGTQLSPYLKITNNKSFINELLFTGETWIRQGDENPYRLTRVIES